MPTLKLGTQSGQVFNFFARFGPICLVLLMNSACAQESVDLNCEYANKVIINIGIPEGAKLLGEGAGTDTYSDEPVYIYRLEMENHDQINIEQKFCSMYNLSIVYRMKSLDQQNFDDSLTVIGALIEAVRQEYRLKAPLSSIVDMTMIQKGYSLASGFDMGLPPQAAESSLPLEHSLGFSPQSDVDGYAAELTFRLGLGGL